MGIGYSVELIRDLLEGYGALEQGQLPPEVSSSPEYLGIMRGKKPGRAMFETAMILKADLDRAIQRLPPQQKFILLAVDIDERTLSDCAYWLGKRVTEVMELENHAIEQMSRFLNGRSWGGRRDGAGRKSSYS